MTWLNPWGWVWLGMAVPVVLLYVLRIRRRRVPVATTRFWEDVLTESRPRVWWQRLRHLVSLLLQLLLLLLLTLAIADPLSASQSRDRRTLVLLIDRSASMNARSGNGASAFDEAIRLAHREVDRLRDWDEGIVVSFADERWVECGRTTHPQRLRRALDGILPSDRAGDPAEALALAQRLHVPGRVKEVVLLTDAWPPHADGHPAGTPGDPPGPVPELGQGGGTNDPTTVHWRMVGDDIPNLAITGLAASPGADGSAEFQILVRLANFSVEAREVSAAIRIDGRPIDALAARLEAGEDRAFTIGKVLPQGGVLEVALDPGSGDGLAADNVARLVIPPPQPIRVAIVATSGNWFLEQALRAIPLVDPVRVPPGERLDPARTDLVIYDQVTPPDLPAIHSLFLCPAAATDLWRVGEPLQNILVSSIDDASPLLRHTRFERVAIRGATPILPEGGATVLGSFGAPLIHVWDGAEVRRAVLTVDLEKSDLALRTAFPILVANLVHWFTGQGGHEIAAPAPGAMGPEGPLERVGLYTFDRVPRAVNLTDSDESDLRRAFVEDANADSGTATGARPWWRWLVWTALALVTVEWGLHQRRWVE